MYIFFFRCNKFISNFISSTFYAGCLSEMYSKCEPEGEFDHDLGSGVVVTHVTLSRVGRQEQSARHPVRQHAHGLPGGPGLLLVCGVEVEQHPLLLHSHQALVQPGTVGGGRAGLPGLDKVFAPDRHLEAAVDDLTSGAEVF